MNKPTITTLGSGVRITDLQGDTANFVFYPNTLEGSIQGILLEATDTSGEKTVRVVLTPEDFRAVLEAYQKLLSSA